MIAVVKIGGHQEIVSIGEKIEVDKLHAKVGETVTFETLLISEADGSGFKIGAPVLTETVEAKILEHGRGTKIKVFKMKPRKRYRRTQGHRQDYTLIEITKIAGKATAPKKAAAKTTVKKAAPAKAKSGGADDLTKIEGVGPKIAEHLNNAGFTTFAELGGAKIAELRKVLKEAGPKFAMHEPKTWAKQSKMAAAGKWDELKKLQDELDGGK